ncbi:MAG TPA: SAV_2336 N-terminal domain-related protein [Thermoanaerobaculia bacterium]|nr:SAV_2336 N-terminal domain-related protein [Thermoanaerobaculia bacterium]
MADSLSVETLQRIAQKLRESDGEFELQSRELLDAVWLASILDESTEHAGTSASTARVQANIAAGAKSVPPAIHHDPPPVDDVPGKSKAPQKQQTRQQKDDDGLAMFVDDAQVPPSHRAVGTPFRAPAAQALPESLRISRALRPLMRRVPSRTVRLVDEVATAERIAEEKILDPVRKPALSRWLNLALVVDRGGAMHVWGKSITELRAVLERHGAFGAVRAWNLHETAEGITINSWSQRSRAVKPLELIDPARRQLILLVSDCVSSAWMNGQMAALLSTWSTNGPVVLLDVLPDRLWSRSAIRHATPVLLRSTAPAMPNRGLTASTAEWFERIDGPSFVKIPIATLDSASLKEIAQLVAATGGATARGVVLKPDETFGEADRLECATAADLVAYFDNRASAPARQLARVFAAAPYPLIPPVMRVIQQTVFQSADPSTIAEAVLIGGLMQRTEEHTDAEKTRYDFISKDVRDALLCDANRADLLDVLMADVSNHVREHLGETIDFAALIRDPQAISGLPISEAQRPFAIIGADILRRLGGHYRDVGAALMERVFDGAADAEEDDAPTRAALFASWMNTPRQRRVELAAALGYARAQRLTGISTAPQRNLTVWFDAIAAYGLTTVLRAIVAATAHLSGSDESEPVWTNVLEMLRARAEGKRVPSKAEAAPDSMPMLVSIVAATISATLLAEHPPATKLRNSIATIAGQLLARSSFSELRRIMRKALLDELIRPDSAVPDRLASRGLVAVAGTGTYELTDVEQSTSVILGRKLARAGYSLLTGGARGVDHLTARSFATELEILGYDSNERLTQIAGTKGSADFPGGRIITATWDDAVRSANVVITIGGLSLVDRFLQHSDAYILPLPWTGRASLKFAQRAAPFGLTDFLDEPDIRTPADVELMVDRVLAVLERPDDALWREYRLALQEPDFDRLSSVLSRLPHVGQWLSYDYLHADDSLDQIDVADFVEHHAQTETLAWAARYLRTATALPPTTASRNAHLATRYFFDTVREHDAWLRRVADLDTEELQFRLSVPREAFDLAARYLAPVSITKAEESSEALRRTIRAAFQKNEPEPEWLEPFLLSEKMPVRVVGFMFLRLFELSSLPILDLANCLSREVTAAEKTRETRPLWQLLLACAGFIERRTASERRILARALREALARLMLNAATVDPGGECKSQIRGYLRGALGIAVAENRALEKMLALPPQKLPTRAPLMAGALTGAELASLINSDLRYVPAALHLASSIDDAESLDLIVTWINASGLREREAALQAAARAAGQLSRHRLIALLRALEHHKAIFGVTGRFDETWRHAVDAYERLQNAPFAPVAILGNDLQDRLAVFCGHLGRELGAAGVAVITASLRLANRISAQYRAPQRLVLYRAVGSTPARATNIEVRSINGDLQRVRKDLLDAARAVIVIGGREGTRQEVRLARERGLPIIALPQTEGFAARLARESIESMRDAGVSDDIIGLLLRPGLDRTSARAAAQAVRTAIRNTARAIESFSLTPSRRTASKTLSLFVRIAAAGYEDFTKRLALFAWSKGVQDQLRVGRLIESIIRELASARHEQSLSAKTPFAAAAKMLLERLGRGER